MTIEHFCLCSGKGDNASMLFSLGSNPNPDAKPNPNTQCPCQPNKGKEITIVICKHNDKQQCSCKEKIGDIFSSEASDKPKLMSKSSGRNDGFTRDRDVQAQPIKKSALKKDSQNQTQYPDRKKLTAKDVTVQTGRKGEPLSVIKVPVQGPCDCKVPGCTGYEPNCMPPTCTCVLGLQCHKKATCGYAKPKIKFCPCCCKSKGPCQCDLPAPIIDDIVPHNGAIECNCPIGMELPPILRTSPSSTFDALPMLPQRYHGPACMLEISVLEHHNPDCGFRKRANPMRTFEDQIGSYEVIGRHLYRTCAPY